ncbi:MAG: 30S ribosome-binding factor RbfA [Oscillospiraceae bacterium]
MPSFRIDRTSEDIKNALITIFRELKDPRISDMISIIKLDLSGDLSHCKVYISSITGNTEESVKGLKSASGFIRKEISQRVKLRKAPEFHFIADNSIQISADINKTLLELNVSKED